MWRYKDGVGVERCEMCFSALKAADSGPLVLLRADDAEDLLIMLVEYVDCPFVWALTCQRLEQAIGQTYAQIKERKRIERLSKEVSTS